MTSTSTEDLRVGTGYGQVLKMAMPITLAMLVPQINFITNNIFLSGLGEDELASAGLTGVYYMIFAMVGSGLSNGIQMLMARRAGENSPAQIGILFFNGSRIALAFGFLGVLIAYTITPGIINYSVHNPETAARVIEFLKIRMWGLPFLYLYGLRNAMLVGVGKTKYLVWGTMSEAIVNIVLDYALIYGKLGFPLLGFNGAAYASVVAEGVGLLVVFSVIRLRSLHVQFSLIAKQAINFKVVRLILIGSSPLILQYAISIITWEYFYILIEHYGERALAVSNTMRNIFGVVGIFSWAFAATTNTMVSNLIGQGRSEEVLLLIKRIMLISICFCFPIIAALNIAPHWFLGVYGLGGDFITAAVPVLRVVSIALALMSFSAVWLNAVTGSGNTKVNLFIEIFAIVIYVIYVTVVLEFLELGVAWGWGSEVLYWISMFVPALIYMRSGRWKGTKI
jgi:multidrug resistance protein, MATE family